MTEIREIKKVMPARETVQTRSDSSDNPDVSVSVTPAKPKKPST